MSIPFNPITISVGKKSLSSFISLQIEQHIGKHHRFQMSVELETGSNRYVHNINSSKKWLGESIVVKAAKHSYLRWCGDKCTATPRGK